MPHKIVILAGGYGTRLRPLTYTRPKPMLPLAGKPVLQHIIESLEKQGFDELIITTNYLCENIIKYFGNGSRFGVRIIYYRENTPLGTAGSVKNCEEHLVDTFGVIQSDNITDLDLKTIFQFHRKKKGIGTLGVLYVDNPQEVGILELDKSDKVVRFLEKPKPEECFSNLANMGAYVLEPEVLDYIPKGKFFDFSKDLYPRLLRLKKAIYGLKTECFWTDVGCFENFMKANKWILDKQKPKEIKNFKNQAEIKGPVYIGENVSIEYGASIFGPTIIDDDCRIHANSIVGPSSMLGPNVEIGNESQVKGSIIYENTLIENHSRIDECIIGENCWIGSKSILNKNVVVGPNCRIGNHVWIEAGARVWPDIEVESNSTVKNMVIAKKAG